VSVARDAQDEGSLVPEARVVPPLYGEAVRALVPLERRRRLLAAVRGSRPPLSTVGETRAGLLRAVVWALECGVLEAPARLVAAMRAGLALHRPDLVVQIGHAALEAGGGTDAVMADVLLLRAQAWRLLDQPARASRDLAEVPPYLAGQLEQAGQALRAVRLAEQEADLRQFADGDADGAVAILDDARERLGGEADPAVVDVLETARLRRLAWGGRYGEVLPAAVARLSATGAAGVEVLRLAAPTALGLGQSGRFPEALRVVAQHLPTAVAHQEELPWLAGEMEVAEFLVRLWSGDVERAEALMRPQARPRNFFSGYYAFSNMGCGLVLAARGQWSDAWRELRLAGARFSVVDPTGLAAYALAVQAVAAAAVGEGSVARQLLAEVARTPLRAASAVESDVRLHVLDAGAWLRRDGLRADALALARWCAERGLRRTEAEALHRAVLAGHLVGAAEVTDGAVVERLGEVVRGLDGDRPRALAAHARAVLARDEQMVVVAARELGRCGLWLPTAARSGVLTRREREIAGLAAGGLSSREIAQRLTLSVRTVDSHLSRVFAKLGVRSRQELGPALRG
jgi:DNA-binding CsgD family transcriptional regulator